MRDKSVLSPTDIKTRIDGIIESINKLDEEVFARDNQTSYLLHGDFSGAITYLSIANEHLEINKSDVCDEQEV